MMPQPDMQADAGTVRAHLSHITSRWHELDESCLLELVFLSAEDKAKVRQVMHYTPDENGIEMAVSDVKTWNKMGANCYATVNPVSEKNRPDPHKRANASQIIASFFHWADADDEIAANNIRNFVGPKPTFFVITGTEPCVRPHVYWELEEPTRNLDAWSRTQRAIAETLKSDASVVDPPRIMRVAGAVNWPKPQKQAKGYKAELVTMTIKDEDERPPVTSEQMARAFPGGKVAASGGLHIDTGVIETLDRERTAIKAMSGEEWNTNVFRLVGSYVRKGLGDAEILALVEPLTTAGYTVADTRDEVQAMIDRTRSNPAFEGVGRDEQFRELSDTEKDAIPAALFQWWKPIDLASIPAPEFLYSDFYARGYTSLTVAAPKVGKSMLGLAEAIDAATGRGFLTGIRRDPIRVVYYNAEDDQNTVDGRVSALLTEYDIDQSEIVGQLSAVSGVDRGDFFMVSGQDGIINEALFVSLEKFCEQERADLLIFDPLQDLSRSPETNEVFRILGQRLRRLASRCGVGLGLIHHTRKVANGVTPSIDDARGGGAIRGTARFNRVLVAMTEEEGLKAGIENHRHYMRIGDMESNLAPPSADVNRWFEKASVQTPNGQFIGAVRPWEWPDAFDGINPQDARKVQVAVAQMEDNPPLESNRSPQRWVGVVVADVLGLDLDDKAVKARVNTMVKTWIKSGVLEVVDFHDSRAGRDRRAVICGPNNPTAEENYS